MPIGTCQFTVHLLNARRELIKLKSSTLLERIEEQRNEGEKDQIIKGLSALLIVTPSTRSNARSYIENAIAYIEKK